MSKTFLITGGAGFIGSHLADQLLREGHHVRVLDTLASQVHGEHAERPDYLADEVELVRGDVRDADALTRALQGIDGVYHLAAAVGVGQSMYEIAHYTDTNNLGTARLLEALIDHRVEKLVVASSMSIYGEGMYVDADGEPTVAPRRPRRQLLNAQWEVCDAEGRPLQPVPTPESKPPDLSSIYALSKYDQERMCLMVGEAYDIPVTALRFFNVYGPRQALSNPYTGVLAIFTARYLNNNPPLIFEDGHQRRDFVSVHDVAHALRLAYDTPDADGEVFNIGSGQSFSICEIAERVGRAMGMDIAPDITGNYRVGDIRHCFADTTHARELLGYRPEVDLEHGLAELVEWLPGSVTADHFGKAHDELTRRGLTL
ncbi:MAG TPA: SDR family NAD(P)-dependent oxidoreductase [Oleiagrimonas sp.]|nr:SDR family NAD(P)-dependent oxidoreductase [Oleiagrimonas sp.]